MFSPLIRFIGLGLVVLLPGIAYSCVSADCFYNFSGDETPASYTILTENPVSPFAAAVVNGSNRISETITLKEIVLFDFREDHLIYSEGCYEVDLKIKDQSGEYASGEYSAVELTFYKNSDMKSGYNKMVVYYKDDNSIHHIEFGRTIYYF